MDQFSTRAVGIYYESLAARYLQEKGIEIRERNFRCHMGEIDIIGKEEGVWIFCEVKYRTNLSYGYPEESVNWSKQKKIRRVASFYLQRQKLSEDTPCRFDVISIQGNGKIDHYINAFGSL